MSCPFKDMLGRYELINPDKNQKKFWTCTSEGDGTYTTSHGRIGATPICNYGLTEGEAHKIINKKIAKGYEHKLSDVGTKKTEEIFKIKRRKTKHGSKVTAEPTKPKPKSTGDENNPDWFMDELRKI